MNRNTTVCCFLLLASSLLAQEFRATVTGHVTDASGAVMPNVNVQITNLDTNVAASAQSNTQGIYTLPFLSPGRYRLTAETSGFKKYIRDNIVLNVGDVAGVNVSMEVGESTQSVTVRAETPVLQTENANRGLVVDQLRVSELPLSARNPFVLVLLAAGVNYNGPLQFLRPFDGMGISMNGGDSRNEFLLDGAPNTRAAGSNIALVPPVDSVEEFKVQTNSYDAAFGKTSGGIVNVTLKSGTNQFHGTLYEFMRRNPLDANTFSNNAVGIAKSAHFLDQYGGSVGGPILFPKYNGRDRSFFFFNYEGYREGTPTPLSVSVPAPEMLTGDFSKLVDAQGRAITIFDPLNAVINANGTVTRSPFPNNRIGRPLDPVVSKILSYFPKPNRDSAPGQAYGSGNLFIAGGTTNLDQDDFYNMVIKFDQTLKNTHHLFFRHASNDRTEFRNTNGVRGPGWTGPDPQKRINDGYVLDWVGTMSPTLITGARLSYGRYKEPSSGIDVQNSNFDMTSLGFPASLVSRLPYQDFGTYTFGGFTNLGQHGGNFTVLNTWALALSVTKAAGAHSLKAGADLRRIYFNDVNPGTGLELGFTPAWTQRQFNQADALSGNTWASALLGLPANGNTSIAPQAAYLIPYYALYLADDWKVSRKLTLNLGLRWDFFPGSTERYDRMARGFDPSATSPINASINRTQFPSFPALTGGLLFAAPNQSTSNMDMSGIQPRIGLAYQITSKLVARGGWGRYMINPTNDWNRPDGYSQTTVLVNSIDDGRTPIPGLITNPFPNGIDQPPGNSLGLSTLVGRNISFFDPTFKVPYTNQFSFGLQYELPLRSQLEVSYVGNRSYKLQSSADYNLPHQSFRQQCNLLEGGNPLFCDQLVSNPFFGLAQFTGLTLGRSPTLSRNELARPFPHFTGINQLGRNDAKIWYNSLQVTYGIASSHGLSLTFTYAFSKQMTGNLLDPVAGVHERSVGAQDRPHVVKISTVYQLPIGKGRTFLSGAGRWTDALVGGWEYNMIFNYQSGVPWGLPTGTRYVRDAKVIPEWDSQVVTGARRCVAQMNDNGSITLMSFSQSLAGCSLDNYNFLRLPRYAPSEGPLRASNIRLLSKPIFDVSIGKTLMISEKMRFQFRAEAFNALNSFLHRGSFNSTITSSSFAQFTPSTVGNGQVPPRHVQLGFKLIF